MFLTEIIGHEREKKLFSATLKNKTIGNAYLFVGIDGIGKKKFAVELVKATNCICNSQDIPCNACLNCKRISDANFPDIMVIEPDGKNIKTDQIKSLIKETSYAPIEALKRFIIINEAHAMNVQSANAFLKTLEDSADHTSFILISSDASIIPKTVISRCQVIKFSPLKDHEVISILKKNDISCGEKIINGLSSGSVTRTIDFNNKFNIEKLIEIFTQFCDINPVNFDKIFSLAERLSSDYKDPSDIITIFKIFLMDVIRSKLNKPLRLDSESLTYVKTVNKLASNNSLNISISKLVLLCKMELELRHNLNKKLTSEKVLLALI